MKTKAIGSSTSQTSTNTERTSTSQRHGLTFAKVQDGRKQDIRGLWIRGERYYAQLTVEDPITGIKSVKRIPLKDKDGNPVGTVAEARAEMARLQTQRADNTLPVLGQQPKFGIYAADYVKDIAAGRGAKKAGTIEKEKTILARWGKAVGQLRLDQIKRVHVNRFIQSRLEKNVSPRTINLDVIAFRNVMKRALQDGMIQRLPTEGLKPLKVTTEKRALFTAADLDKLCRAAIETNEEGSPVTKNGQELGDYLRFMAYSGARRNEALGVQWADVDSDNGQLHIRRQVTHRGIEDLKNREQRTVDLNAKLRDHLADMKARRQGVSQWLFPSPQRGDQDIPAKTFRESLELAKARAKMPHVGNHDMRHHFISMCVMSGIDFMTIAAWVGHKDGGVLIGKVYGHLANEHRKAMAEKLNFGPVVLGQTS